jgi:hypothetical protein
VTNGRPVALSEEDRSALGAHWLGEPLPEALARLLDSRPRSRSRRKRQDALRRYLAGLTEQTARQTRRLILTYGQSAVARLVELMRGDHAETARKAAVDLLRHWEWSLRDELAAESRAASSERQRMTDRLSDEQVEQVWAILADAAAGDSEEARGDDDSGNET